MENPSTAPRGLIKNAPRGFFLRGHLQQQRGERTLRGLRVHLRIGAESKKMMEKSEEK